MSNIKLYQYKKCSTCVKASKFLASKGIDHNSIDITEKPPAKKELKAMLSNYDGEIKKLFNTSGVQYRELKIKDKIGSMTTAEAIDLLSKNGKLVKRPFIIAGEKGLVGYKEDEWKALFK